MRRLLLAAGLLALAHSPALAEPATYKIDPGHTALTASFSHFGFSTSQIRFVGVDATLTFDPAAPETSTVEAKVDIGSVQTAVPKFTEHLLSSDFLDGAKFPSATFKSTSVTKTGDKTGTMTGDLTIRDKTVPVTFDVTFYQAGKNFRGVEIAGFKATTTVKRSDFGMGAFTPADGNPGVSDEIALTIDAEFAKQ